MMMLSTMTDAFADNNEDEDEDGEDEKTHKYERSAELTTTGRKGGAIAVVEVRVPETQTIRFYKTLQ